MSTDPHHDGAGSRNAAGRHDERERAVDERERLSDARESAADTRERTADEREVSADAREASADERENRLTAWEREVDERDRAAGRMTAGVRERAYEQISRSRDQLTSAYDSLRRSEAALRRGDARDAREQDAVTREAAASTARQVVEGRLPRQDLERRERLLREQAAAALSALADVEEALVREYERDDRPQQADRYRRRAQQRRDTADGLRAGTGGAGEETRP
ncbi:hypothetical protein ACFYWU_15100 [Streptomyces chrestomyceticus]|uniref:hypothetical protein n=1 Tax=Streptomyces chrestomyceticus TaxID=68185 RepID=UPI00367B252A